MSHPMRFPSIVDHYPFMLHGGDYNPEQWLKVKDTVWKEDMRLAKEAGINCLSVGIFSWAALEPEEGVYTLDWLDEVMDMLYQNGIRADLATPSGARPRWMAQKYPEVLRVNPDGTRNFYGERHNHCPSSPVYRQKVTQINTVLAKRYAHHPALAMWHISNEVSGECFCPLCRKNFQNWLQEKYGSLDNINDAWWTAFWSHQYTRWDQLEPPSPKGDSGLHGLNLAWKRFTTDQHIRFLEAEKAPLRQYTPDIPVTANLMAGYEGINYNKYAEHLDFVSWDNYPLWKPDNAENINVACETAFRHDLMYGLKRRPWLLMESTPSQTNWQPVARLHRPGVLKLQSAQAVAHGSDGVMYFQFRKGRGSSEKFHGAVVGHDGTGETRVFKEVKEIGETLPAWKTVVGMGKDARVALIYDYENNWAIGDIRGALQEKTGIGTESIRHYRALWQLGVSVDILSQEESLEGYKMVVLPMGYLLKEGFAERLKDFVRAGGLLVGTYLTGYVNKDDLCFQGGFPGPLREVFGLWSEELDALYPEEKAHVQTDEGVYEAFDLCETIRLEGAEQLGVYLDDFRAGTSAITVHSYGKGKAYYLAARMENAFLEQFYVNRCAQSGLDMPGRELPEGVNVQKRTDGETEARFYMNFTNLSHEVQLPDGKKITLRPYGVEVIMNPLKPKQ